MHRIEHKMIGEFHVFTSPDVPGLYVADRDRDVAERNVQPTIEVLHRMAERRKDLERVMRPAVAAE